MVDLLFVIEVERAERRPQFAKPARIPLGDRRTYPFGEGQP